MQVASDGDVTVIDSRCGEDFAVFQRREGAIAIVPQFDACASWWTQVTSENHVWQDFKKRTALRAEVKLLSHINAFGTAARRRAGVMVARVISAAFT